ncbi:hypothetical protein TNCV_3705601 [Trichonephila clavipes]|nr:hypothetical protein TNCV_3705601 [Trichonephila clavipes]
MRGLNQVNLARLYRSKAKRKVFFHKKHVVVNVDHPLVGIFQESIGISQQSFGDFLPQDIVGPEFVQVLGLQDGTLEIIQQCLFFGTNGLCKTRQTLVLHWVPDKGCKHGRVPAERHIPRRRASRAASRVLRSWKCAQERHQLDPLCSKGKRRLMGSVD